MLVGGVEVGLCVGTQTLPAKHTSAIPASHWDREDHATEI